MKIIAAETLLYRSPDPHNLYCYSPWLAEGFDGRLLASFDIAGPGLAAVPGPKSSRGDYGSNQCEIFVSDDRGKNWRHTGRLPMLHARVFKAGDSLWTLGHSGRMLISRSRDNGETWNEPAVLDSEYLWHQAPCAVDIHNGKIFLTMEHAPLGDKGWAGGDPVLMAAKLDADLSRRESWRFSNCLRFAEDLPHGPNPFGFTPGCWLESNVVRITDPHHLLYDPDGRSVLIFSRCELGRRSANVAAVVRGVEHDDGSLSLELLRTEDGEPLLYVPFPGGYMKFHLLRDPVESLWWLIASRAETGEFLPRLKNGSVPELSMERQRLELFWSRNLFDWCSAGLIASGRTETCSYHYASLLIDGDRLSPNIEPPTTVATQRGRCRPPLSETAAAIGTRTDIVPTLVPMAMEIRHAIMKSPGMANWAGMMESRRLAVLDAPPASFAMPLNAPASRKINSMMIPGTITVVK